MNLPARIVLAVALLAANTALAEKIYRWVDADGQVHFSATPPPGQQLPAEDLRYQKTPEQDAAGATRDAYYKELEAKREEEAGKAAEAAGESQAAANQRAERCEQAQAIVGRLEGGNPATRYKRDDGSYARYSDEERDEKLTAAREAVETNCD